jgi:hypothetical protein
VGGAGIDTLRGGTGDDTAEIGQAVGLHYATISRIMTAMEKTS